MFKTIRLDAACFCARVSHYDPWVSCTVKISQVEMAPGSRFHSHCKPYDQRQCGLLDAAETFALSVRFSNFVMIAVLLLFNAPQGVAWAIGGAVLLANVVRSPWDFRHLIEGNLGRSMYIF